MESADRRAALQRRRPGASSLPVCADLRLSPETLARERALCIQLGGAVGTLDALGSRRVTVRHGLAVRLQLREAPAWHDQRDELLRAMAELAIVTETVGKIARDVALLSQAEVGEMLESPPTKGVGGSSAMPHKRNPCRGLSSGPGRRPSRPRFDGDTPLQLARRTRASARRLASRA